MNPSSGIIINYVDYILRTTNLDKIRPGLQKLYDQCYHGPDMAGEVRLLHIDGINEESLDIANAYVYNNGKLDQAAWNKATERIKYIAECKKVKVYVSGNDDYSLEKEFFNLDEAFSVFNEILSWKYVNKQSLKDLGFENG